MLTGNDSVTRPLNDSSEQNVVGEGGREFSLPTGVDGHGADWWASM